MSVLIKEVFPTQISYGSSGGPNYRTTVVEALSGAKSRNVEWQYPLHTYDVAYGVKTIEEMLLLIDFFHVAQGRAYTFLYKDWADFNSSRPFLPVDATDQIQGAGDGNTTEFPLMKNYTVGSHNKQRRIKMPIESSVRVAIDGVPTASFTMLDKGIIKMHTAPDNGAVVTAGYEFYVPVSFDSDSLSSSFDAYESNSASVTLTEDRL